MKIKPYTPQEALDNKIRIIPDEMIDTINEFLLERFNGTTGFSITQDEIVERFLSKYNVNGRHATEKTILDNHWLDFEPLYRNSNWKVDYDKPGYGDNYKEHFLFARGDN